MIRNVYVAAAIYHDGSILEMNFAGVGATPALAQAALEFDMKLAYDSTETLGAPSGETLEEWKENFEFPDPCAAIFKEG